MLLSIHSFANKLNFPILPNTDIPIKDLPTRIKRKIRKNREIMNLQETFDLSLIEYVYEYMNKYNLTNEQFYKKADLSKQTFSNFISSKNPPSRNTLISILFAMELPENQVLEWLSNFGFHMSHKQNRDELLLYIHNLMLIEKNSNTYFKYSVKDINTEIIEYSIDNHIKLSALRKY
jgi:hypothetical protein